VTGPQLAFAGEPGAFAEDAAIAYRRDARPLPVASFGEVIDAVATGRGDGGVLPIENVSQGTVREVYDLLLDSQLVIVGEVEMPVRLCLAALAGQTLDDITCVYSHVQALAQAGRFLAARDWTLLASTTTAGAGSDIARRAERGAAAVLSPRAAALHGLEVLVADIANDPQNRTRFLILSPEPQPWWLADVALGQQTRTTVAFGLPNESGSLVRALAPLAERGVNITKIESRPSRGRDWEYVFWADLDVDLMTPEASDALEALRSATESLRVMGSYPAVRAGSAPSGQAEVRTP
jgi:prephenate dehydratase